MNRRPFTCVLEIAATLGRAADRRAEQRKIQAASKPSMPGIKGGQGRQAHELWNAANALWFCAWLGAGIVLTAAIDIITRSLAA